MALTVKQWRMAKGLTQERMANACNVHRNTYASWEEHPEDISLKNAIIICNALGEPFNEVFFNLEIPQNVVKEETA